MTDTLGYRAKIAVLVPATNTIVVDIDTERGILRAHELEPTQDPVRGAMPLGRP